MVKRSIIGKITGFTLAEVLITLTIIGVIAALTIPSLITNIQDAQLRTAWKRVYSDLNQVNQRVLLNNGGSIKNICSDWNNDCLANLYKPYLSYVKQCNNGTTFGNCWQSFNNFYWLDGVAVNTWGDNTGVILSNGVSLLFENWSQTCTYDSYNDCGSIIVDVNGLKPPNTFGKDMFAVHILESSIKPKGSVGDGSDNCTAGTLGTGCAAKYLMQ